MTARSSLSGRPVDFAPDIEGSTKAFPVGFSVYSAAKGAVCNPNKFLSVTISFRWPARFLLWCWKTRFECLRDTQLAFSPP